MTRQLVSVEAEQRTIGSIILHLRGNDKPADAVTIGDVKPSLQLGNSTLLVAVELARNTSSTANTLTYSKTVKERAQVRKIFRLADQIKSMSQESRPISDIVADIQNLTLSLDSTNDEIDVCSLSDALGNVIDKIDDRFNNRGINGLETGLVDLDKIVKGLRPSHMVVVAGRPGTGKTTLAINIAEHNAYKHGKSCMIFSLEMSKTELAERSLTVIQIVT